LLVGSIGLPLWQFDPNLFCLSRIDTNYFAGNGYGWVRGIMGLVYRPVSRWSLSAAGFSSIDAGHSLYLIDQLDAAHGYILRTDVNLGPTKFSYLTKFNPSLGWYDREYTVSQVAGAIEVFLISRRYPNEYNLGFRLRLDEFYDVIRRRNFRNPAPAAPMTISPKPDGKP
jgi:hypothetical protein